MRLLFVGSTIFGFNCLRLCLTLPEIHVCGILTTPKQFKISYHPSGVTNVLHRDFTEIANAYDIPLIILQSSMNDKNLFETVKRLEPDALLVVGWYHLIPKSWLEMFPAFALHSSLLPDYSGGAPLVWAIINGEEKTGITLFKMDCGVDSGPIIAQKEEPIYFHDTISSLYSRIEMRGVELLEEFLPKIACNCFPLKEQDERKRRTFPQRCPSDGKIDWDQEAISIIRFIRAQTHPYPGAFTLFRGEPLYIWKAELFPYLKEKFYYPPGTLNKVKNDYVVFCKDSTIILSEVSFLNKSYNYTEMENLFGNNIVKFD